jgi:hypothetical protein
MKWLDLRNIVKTIIDQDGIEVKNIMSKMGKTYSKMVRV